MASPQKEDGYTPIAHEILEQLSKQVLSPDEWRILMVIFRKTYGWDKKYDKISHTQFSEVTGIARGHVPMILKKLLERRIIFKSVPQPGDCPPIRGRGVPYLGDRHMATYGFQKNYDLWCPLARGQRVSPEQGTTGVPQSGPGVSPDQGHTKDILTKERNTSSCSNSDGVPQPGDPHTYKPKRSSKTFAEDTDAFRLAALLLQKIKDRKPNFKKPNLQNEAGAVDQMMRIDGRSAKSIENVIVWCQKDDFWQNNILSTGKLRRQFDQLELKMEKETGVAPYRKPDGGSPSGPIPEPKSLKKFREAQEQIEKEHKENGQGKEKPKPDEHPPF